MYLAIAAQRTGPTKGPDISLLSYTRPTTHLGTESIKSSNNQEKKKKKKYYNSPIVGEARANNSPNVISIRLYDPKTPFLEQNESIRCNFSSKRYLLIISITFRIWLSVHWAAWTALCIILSPKYFLLRARGYFGSSSSKSAFSGKPNDVSDSSTLSCWRCRYCCKV